MRFFLILAASASCLAAPAPKPVDDGRAVNDEWGEKIRVAMGTFSKADDVELAQKMVAAAESKKTPPGLAAALAERAADLASRDPAGFLTAIKAYDIAIAHAPDEERRQAWMLRGIEVRERAMPAARGDDRARLAGELVAMSITAGQSRLAAADTAGAIQHLRKALSTANAVRDGRADSLRESIDLLMTRQRDEQQLETVITRLKQAPGDAVAIEKLIQLAVVELDDPARAAPVVTDIADAGARRALTFAAKPVGALTEDEAKEVGEWYRTHAEKASAPLTKAAMLARAQAAYAIHLVRHGEKDAAGRAARTELNKIDTELAALPRKPAPLVPPAVAKVDTWRALNTNFTQAAQWENKGGAWAFIDGRIRGRGDSRIVFSHALPEDFTLEFKLNALDGRRAKVTFLGLDFAAGNEGPTQVISLHGEGLTAIKGSPIPYANGKELKVTITCAGELVILQVDSNAPITAKRKVVKPSEIELRAGDNWSPGTTDFYGLRVSPVSKEK